MLGAILVWAWELGGATAWVVFGVAAGVLVVGGVVKYLVPNRRLKDAGIPASTQWVGAALGIVGFFVMPVVGLLIGFVLGVYLAEYRRVGATAAWPSTVHALKAVGLSILIELAAGAHGDVRLGRRGGPHVTVLLSLLAAASYGLSDFNGGVGVQAGQRLDRGPGGAVRRHPGHAGDRAARPRPPVRGPTWPGRCSPGVGNGFGTAFLYRGLSLGADGRGGAGLRAWARPSSRS